MSNRCNGTLVGSFPDGNSAWMLATARLRHIAGTRWGTRRYMEMAYLHELKKERSTQQRKKVG
ncbi:hypothetical protein ACFL6U_24705 [Planctomycetota bacterium]